jgi:ABC-2 type transport system permease protein
MIRKVLLLYYWHWRVTILHELQYRVNFFLQLFQSSMSLAVGLIGLQLVFQHTPTLAGWRQAELLLVLGAQMLLGGWLRASVQPSMERLLGEIQEGKLDFALSKPVDAQILVSIRETRVWQLVDCGLGLAVLGYAATQLPNIHWPAVLLAALLLGCGAVMLYSFWLVLSTIAFWATRVENALELFQGLWQAGRWPVTIYPDWLRYTLTFVVPIGFAVTLPAEALTARLTWPTFVLAIGVTLCLLGFSRWFWLRGLRAYGGASA